MIAIKKHKRLLRYEDAVKNESFLQHLYYNIYAATSKSCISATQRIPQPFVNVRTIIELFFYCDIIHLLKQIDKSDFIGEKT